MSTTIVGERFYIYACKAKASGQGNSDSSASKIRRNPMMSDPAQFRIRLISPAVKAFSSEGARQSAIARWKGYS
jgi:hypothetical protein